MKRNFYTALFFIFLFGSCRTPENMVYFQGIENLTEEQKEAMNQKYVPRIAVDDALIIYVSSPDRTSATPFAMPPYGYYMPGETEVGVSASTQNIFTYLVDEQGDINFPLLGRIHLAGLTINEAVRKLESLIWETAPTAVVSVQIANFRVCIIGEIRRPDIYSIRTQRGISILELIARAGDLTLLGDRKNVWLHRDNNGEKIQVKLDLTDPMLFASPYFYLQQNDMIYVLPTDVQKKNTQYSQREPLKVALFSAIASSVTVIIAGFITLFGQKTPTAVPYL